MFFKPLSRITYWYSLIYTVLWNKNMHVYVFLFQTIFCSVTFLRFNAHACMYMHISTMSCLSTWRNCARIRIYACRSRFERRTQYTLCKLFFRWLPRSKCCSSKTWFMCTLCTCYLVDCSTGTMDNTAAVILLYRQVTGSAPSNAPLKFQGKRRATLVWLCKHKETWT